MAVNELPPNGDDLDALIGDLRREAARRRASPDFPLDEEARLAAAMDRQGPTGQGVNLDAVLAALDSVARAVRADQGQVPAPRPRFRGRGAERNQREVPVPGGQGPGAAEVAELAAAAVRRLAAQVAHLEWRTRELEARLGHLADAGAPDAGAPGGGAPGAGPPDLPGSSSPPASPIQ